MIEDKNDALPKIWLPMRENKKYQKMFDTKKEVDKVIKCIEEDYEGVSEVIYAPIKHLKTGKFYIKFLGAFR